jgi:hypothetical protein
VPTFTRILKPLTKLLRCNGWNSLIYFKTYALYCFTYYIWNVALPFAGASPLNCHDCLSGPLGAKQRCAFSRFVIVRPDFRISSSLFNELRQSPPLRCTGVQHDARHDAHLFHSAGAMSTRQSRTTCHHYK